MIIAAFAAILGAVVLPPGILAADAGRLLVTFLGLVAASLLPTITLIVNSMSSSGRSVLALNELKDELSIAVDALLMLFGLSASAVIVLVLLTIPTPEWMPFGQDRFDVLNRVGQGVVCLLMTLVVSRMSIIPAVLRRVLQIRHETAVDESKRSISESAPTALEVKSMFPRSPGFGKTVKLEELQKDA